MGMFGDSYTECPHFDRRHQDEGRISKLEAGHEAILGRLETMANRDEEQSTYLKKHMEDEGTHHTNTNETLGELAKAVNALITDKKDRDNAKDKKERFRDKILSSVALVVIIGIGKLLLDLYATTRVLGVE